MALRRNQRYVRFWLASTVSDFGTYVTTVALSVLIVVTLDGSAFDQGIVNAARWAPYALFGLVAGIWIDRFKRTTVLIAGDFGRGALLCLLCATALLDLLTVPMLLAIIFAFGLLALFSDAAHQSFLPLIVPRSQLTRANARLQQSETVAQTTGAAIAGGFVAIASAPLALLFDAGSYFASGLLLSSIRRRAHDPINRGAPGGGSARALVGEGLRWIYRHRHLGPLAVSTHVWFIGFSMTGAVVPSLVLREMGFGSLGLGLILSGAGIGAVLGTTVSTGLQDRYGSGRMVVAARLAEPPGVFLLALTALFLSGEDAVGQGPMAGWPASAWGALGMAFGGQFIIGAAMGVEGPIQMGFEQSVTPHRLLARMAATRRSVNRSMIVVGAPAGGLLATTVGVQGALWAAGAVMLLAGLIIAVSPFRSAWVQLLRLSDEEAEA